MFYNRASLIAVAPHEEMAAAQTLRQSIVIVTAALPRQPNPRVPAPPGCRTYTFGDGLQTLGVGLYTGCKQLYVFRWVPDLGFSTT